MHYLPEIDADIPSLDILSLVFDSPYCWAKGETVIHAEAGNEINHITKAETADIVRRLAFVLRNEFGMGISGAGKNVVTSVCSNHILSPSIFFAVIASESIYSAASTALTVRELVRQLQSSKSNLVIATEDTASTAIEAARISNIALDRVLILRSMGADRALNPSVDSSRNYLKETRQLEWARISEEDILRNSVVALLYSSGTTGVPKGVRISHKNFVSEAIITQTAIETYLSRSGRQSRSDFQYRTIAHLPSAHISGLQGYFINGTMMGGTVFWMSKYVFDDFVRAAKRHRPTFISTVPSVYLRIAKSASVSDEFHSLEHAQSGAAPMGPQLQKLAESKLKCKISQAWGLTETTGAVTWLPWDREDSTGSISQLLPNTRLKIVDESERPVPDGHPGEILVRGPNVTAGYWGNDKATIEAFTADGWFRTGDIGIRKDGKFYIVDRKKELIKFKGLQVAPAEIEAVLLEHDQILDAGVVGIPDPQIAGNEIPRAFVVRKPGKNTINEEDVKRHVHNNLASHKQLRGGVRFTDLIPRNLSGKILRRKLVQLEEHERPSKL
ncbi:hypothetical protein N7455_010786 [Penicillium solitum]|uniref:uncharacterized protein n=1 Tax=Penicillium solitum TaxID=60172 RepID=UPI0032C44FC9|nr:hypothetical protein N7455_010786 [Penicillium solitum]